MPAASERAAPLGPAEFAEAVTDAREAMLAYAQSLTHNLDAARDLTQEAILHALSKRSRYLERGRLNSWLCCIVHNVWVSGLRRANREIDTYSLTALAHDPHSGESFEREEIRGADGAQTVALLRGDLKRCIKALPADQAEVVFLIGYEGLRYEQAADVLGIPVGTVRSRLARARAEIRLFLEHSTRQRKIA